MTTQDRFRERREYIKEKLTEYGILDEELDGYVSEVENDAYVMACQETPYQNAGVPEGVEVSVTSEGSWVAQFGVDEEQHAKIERELEDYFFGTYDDMIERELEKYKPDE